MNNNNSGMTPPCTQPRCAQCGCMFQATRAYAQLVPPDAMCPECAAYARGYADGEKSVVCSKCAGNTQTSKDAEVIAARAALSAAIDSLESLARSLQTSVHPDVLDD